MMDVLWGLLMVFGIVVAVILAVVALTFVYGLSRKLGYRISQTKVDGVRVWAALLWTDVVLGVSVIVAALVALGIENETSLWLRAFVSLFAGIMAPVAVEKLFGIPIRDGFLDGRNLRYANW